MHWIKQQLKDFYFRLTNRQLWIFLILLGLVFTAACFRFHLSTYMLIAGLVFFAIAAMIPPIGRSVYLLLMALTSPIGWCVSMISLAFVFYVIVSPMRLFKKKQVVGWVKSTETIDPSQQYE
ncbi:MAG: hypothetical protein IT221_05850 [Fluviicola sp.]|nr:hypothetical protein [Fluviicola sp.]